MFNLLQKNNNSGFGTLLSALLYLCKNRSLIFGTIFMRPSSNSPDLPLINKNSLRKFLSAILFNPLLYSIWNKNLQFCYHIQILRKTTRIA
ncbi:hypothetical protein BUQ74_06760 [Leptospira weilii serovar Heyan]|uniref:Uncharacterized protein n=3 Tax=Leptospira weilii TaxID=28184 RepID=M6Q1R1_9LEPT|nr:hypothetical protein LEP1GSC086_3493 [Leptospira weilii str. LNT 1234]EMN89234.1 hypothetical protein LEP1GSC108_4526 [Leptospira weilii str. UI 13098]OMI18065.1 hypothetical protein BUQ74_06760 [Leptospira weilii serovar Heyan]